MLNQEKNKFVIMITQIKGRLIEKLPTEVVVDCNGNGYSINSVGVTAHLTKALQEAIAKIETLETKVAALESS